MAKSNKFWFTIAVLYLIVGLVIGVSGTRIYFLSRGFTAPLQEVPGIVTYVQPPTQVPLSTGTAEPDQERIEKAPVITPVPQLITDVWDIDLSDGAATYFTVYPNDNEVGYVSGEFWPWSYREGIFESDLFEPDRGGAVSWIDFNGRIVLWIHSGPNHTATALQRYIELDEDGKLTSGVQADERLRQNIVGSAIQWNQKPDTEQWTHVAAWARVDPTRVDDINMHVSDLPEYLRDLYPNQGWEGFNRDTLIIFFCGRQLVDDTYDNSRPYWQQTRYVIGLLPMQEGEVQFGPLAYFQGE